MEIILPVYNAAAPLAACLDSLDRHCAPDQPVVVIDDASPDPAIAPLLAAWVERRPGRRLLRHARNRGFVATANHGFAVTDGDVVLLNSDTVVTPGWLDALRRALASDRAIGTATPFSNNAEICSFPDFCRAAPVPADPDRLAAAVARAGPPTYPELPTAVGFCMAVARDCLDAVGVFDEATFGAGYGEENDFCRRAVAGGFTNVLCDDGYVAHVGHASFRDTPWRPGGEAMRRLLGKHPDYEAVVHAFIAADPIAPRRRAIIAGMSDEEKRLAGVA